MKYAKPVVITSAADLLPVGDGMRAAARRKFDPAQVYSKTEEEALAKAIPNTKEIFSDGKTRILNLVSHPGQSYCVILTIESKEADYVWHFSISAVNVALGQPCRVPDDVAEMFCQAFLPGVKEGSSEGVLQQVRHFFGPFVMS